MQDPLTVPYELDLLSLLTLKWDIGHRQYQQCFSQVLFACHKLNNELLKSRVFLNIYIFISIALNETSILVAVHFSMKNNYQSCDLGVDVSQ